MSKNIKCSIFFLLSMLYVSMLCGQTSVRAIQYHNQAKHDFVSLQWNNVSSKFYYPVEKFTDIEMGLLTSQKRDLFMSQEGDAYRDIYFRSKSFYKDSIKVLQGAASYSNTINNNVNWNTASDYNLFYPYIMADTIGGDSYKEIYAFSGAYAFAYKGNVLGLEARYKASLEHREVDPRPLNTCSDLYFAINSVSKIRNTVLLGFNLSYRQYQQKNSVNVFRPSEQYNFLYLRGFGLSSEYFSSKFSRRNNLYHLKEYSAQLAFMPQDTKGLYFISSYKKTNINFMLDANNKSIASMQKHNFTNEIAYKLINNKVSVSLLSDLLIGKAYEYNYKITGLFFNKNNKYNTSLYSSKLNIMYSPGNINTANYFALFMKYNSYRAEYKKDNALQEIDKFIIGVNTNILFQFKKLSVNCNLGVEYNNSLNKNIKLPLNIDLNTKHMLLSNHLYMSENYVETNMNLRFYYVLKHKREIFTKINLSHKNFINYSDNYIASIALGLSL